MSWWKWETEALEWFEPYWFNLLKNKPEAWSIFKLMGAITLLACAVVFAGIYIFTGDRAKAVETLGAMFLGGLAATALLTLIEALFPRTVHLLPNRITESKA